MLGNSVSKKIKVNGDTLCGVISPWTDVIKPDCRFHVELEVELEMERIMRYTTPLEIDVGRR